MGKQVVKKKKSFFRRQTKEQTADCFDELCEKGIIELIKSYV